MRSDPKLKKTSKYLIDLKSSCGEPKLMWKKIMNKENFVSEIFDQIYFL